MRRLLLASALALTSACIVEAPVPVGSSGGSAPAARPAAPPMQLKNGTNFGDAIELSSLILAPSRVSPGETIRVALELKVIGKVPADYMVFVHVEDVDGRVDRLNADHPPARGQVPTSQWQVGQVVRDDFEVMVPPGMQVRGLNIMLGFWDPRTDQRLPVRNPDKVKTDGRDRVTVATVPVIPPQ